MGKPRRRKALLVAPLMAVALVATACGGGASSDGGNAQVRQMGGNDINPQPVDKLKDGGNLNLPLAQWPQQWNFNQVEGVSVDLNRINHALIPEPFIPQADGTVKLNQNLFTSADLVSTSPEVVEYKVNPKAKWSDGKPIGYADFVANWKAQSGTNKGYQPATSAGWQDIGSVDKVGGSDQDFKVTFKTPFAEWKGLTQYLYPASHYSTPDKFNKDWTGKIPVTAGPFKVKNIDNTAKVLTLERDPHWWGPKPKLDTITYKVVPASSQPQAFQGGDIDAVDIGPDVATFQTLQNTQNADIRKALAPHWRVLNFTAKNGSALADVAVRAAIFKGIDRTALGKAVLGPIVPDVHPLGNHIYVEGQKGYQDNGKPYDYNAEKAAAELDASGWKLVEGNPIRQKDGKPLQIVITIPAGTPVSQNEAQIIQTQLKAIGVDLKVNTVELNAWQTDYLQAGNFELMNLTWEGVPFPLSSVTSIYTYDPDSINQNYGRIPDTEGVNDLFKKANAELDDTKRLDLANQIDVAVWKEAFSLPLYQRPDAWGVKKNLANFGAFGFSEPDYTKVGFLK